MQRLECLLRLAGIAAAGFGQLGGRVDIARVEVPEHAFMPIRPHAALVVSRQALDAERELNDALSDFDSTRIELERAAGWPMEGQSR